MAASIELKIKVDLTPEQLACQFCDFDSEQQVAFFATVKKISDTWGGHGFGMQAYWIESHCQKSQESFLSPYGEDAKDLIMTLGAPFYRHALEALERTR